MVPHINPDSLWIISRVKNSLFAVPCRQVQSIIVPHNVTAVPHLPKHIRGVMNYRDQAIHLIDMRILLNMKSLEEEIEDFVKMIDAREQDHVYWINTLNQCIHEEREFTLATDPRLCKFGQWYYQFLPTVEDPELKMLLEHFEKPHNKIHRTAVEVKQLLSEKKKDQALLLIEEKRNYELLKMRELFSQLKNFHRQHKREVLVVVELPGRRVALVVDQVTTITRLAWERWQPMEEMGASWNEKYLLGMTEIPGDHTPVVVLDVACLAHY